MNKYVCKYAIVRFSPFIETGEFANVGIIMMSPKHRFFGFKLEIKRYGRITRFFDDIDASLYRKTMYNLKEEMERINEILKPNGFDRRLKYNDIEFSSTIFDEIIRPRESIIRFSEVRTVLTDNLDKKLGELFAYYVERNFVTKKYQEILLEGTIRKLLYKADLGDRFSKEKIGDEAYHVSFPFVDQSQDDEKIIKPLHLAHEDSTQIYNHGAAWVFKVDKLKEKHYLELDNVLFTISKPPEENSSRDNNRLEAFNEIENDLKKTGVQVVTFNDANIDRIIQFAKH